MKYSQSQTGRTFIIRLENGDIVHEVIEKFCREQGIQAASLTVVGGAQDGSRLVVGPQDGDDRPIEPIIGSLKGVHEVTGSGTVFPDETGQPILHLHLACGRKDQTITGCARAGIKTWHILEVLLTELTETSATRRSDPDTGFALLVP